MGWFKRREIDPDDLPGTEAELAAAARAGCKGYTPHPGAVKTFARNAARDGTSVNDVYNCIWWGADD